MMFIVLTFGYSETARALTLSFGLCLRSLPLRAGAGSPFFVCWQTGLNPISACANTRKTSACHPLDDKFMKSAAFSGLLRCKKIGASFLRQGDGLFVAPFLDRAVIARRQDRRNLASFPFLRTGIV